MIADTEPVDLVYLDEYGVKGSNFYWHKYRNHGLTKEDILSAGLTDDRVRVARTVAELLRGMNRELSGEGIELYVKEGYRSPALYRIVYERRSAKYGAEVTSRLFNMRDMPHASGYAVDVALWAIAGNAEIPLRRYEDGLDALFVDFYRNLPGSEARAFHGTQVKLIHFMMKHGFRLGTRREYFHFNYDPATPVNYPLDD